MKKRLLCPQLPKQGSPVKLSEGEAHHAIRVCRLRDGDSVEALDGNGNRAWVTLRTRGGPPRIEFSPISEEILTTAGDLFQSSPVPVVLQIAALKADAMEWVVEKSVELGIETLVPVLTAHTVVQMKDKGPHYFQERWQKIADQSLKQCGRASRMNVQTPIQIEKIFLQKDEKPRSITLWCDENREGSSLSLLGWLRMKFPLPFDQIKILVGPEGGWSTHERTFLLQEAQIHPIQRIDLGPLTLRAETAVLFAASLVSAHLRSSS